VLVLPLFWLVGTSPVYFFSYQLFVATAELILLAIYAYRLLPGKNVERISYRLAPLHSVLNFSLSIAFTSAVWVLVTQTDKLLLSKLLPLADYAYFTIAVLVAGGITMLSSPISAALLPRMTRLVAAGQDMEMFRIYREATELVTTMVVPTSMVLALFAEKVLWAWTGDASVAAKAAPVLRLYAAGNGVLALAAFPYYLQYAKGDLKLHLIGNALFVIFLIPALVWATLHFGVQGAGWAWLGANAAYFLIWVPRVHRKFAKGLHMRWLVESVIKPLALPLLIGSVVASSVRWPEGRARTVLILFAFGGMLFAGTAAGCQSLRNRILTRLFQASSV
jgi:O-antigen/teichoic acid export membrane protein